MDAFDFSLPTLDLADIQPHLSRRDSESFPSLLRRHNSPFQIPNGLVVSADDSICGHLGETLLLCGVAPTFAANIAQAAPHVSSADLNFVLCQDKLPDGKYADLLRLQRAARNASPLIVISRTGDWPDYFAAVELGAHDFLPYPLVPGELQRIVRGFLDQQHRYRVACSFD
jgi:DNA-binding NtrC family response regulator